MSELKILLFLYQVRTLVVRRLPTARLRCRVWAAQLEWREYTYDDRMRDILRGKDEMPFAETYDNYRDPATVSIYRTGFRAIDWSTTSADKPGPFGRVLAFVLIHELAHVSAQCGHECEEWAQHAKLMGLREDVYSRKVTAGLFIFEDNELWFEIAHLSSYPGDIYDPD